MSSFTLKRSKEMFLLYAKNDLKTILPVLSELETGILWAGVNSLSFPIDSIDITSIIPSSEMWPGK